MFIYNSCFNSIVIYNYLTIKSCNIIYRKTESLLKFFSILPMFNEQKILCSVHDQ